MPKYDYLIITTKPNISEADHNKILSNYGRQGYRLVKEVKRLFRGTTYTLERATEAPKVQASQPSITNLSPESLLIVPPKYILEVTDVLMKGIEASEDLPLEVKKLLIKWISLNRYDLKKKHEKEWKELEE